MTTLWIIAAVIIGGLVCFVLLCKGRTPCIEEAPKIITDELPGDCIELYNYPATYEGVEVFYEPLKLSIKFSHDRYAGLVIHEWELFYDIKNIYGYGAGESQTTSKGKVYNDIKNPGNYELVKAYYDFSKKVLSLDWL